MVVQSDLSWKNNLTIIIQIQIKQDESIPILETVQGALLLVQLDHGHSGDFEKILKFVKNNLKSFENKNKFYE